jgi:hypothetical protein
MKIYRNVIELKQPSDRQILVSPYSDFAIAVKFVNDGNLITGNIILKDEFGNEIPAESDKHAEDFTMFKLKSLGLNEDIQYTVIAPNGQSIKII